MSEPKPIFLAAYFETEDASDGRQPRSRASHPPTPRRDESESSEGAAASQAETPSAAAGQEDEPIEVGVELRPRRSKREMTADSQGERGGGRRRSPSRHNKIQRRRDRRDDTDDEESDAPPSKSKKEIVEPQKGQLLAKRERCDGDQDEHATPGNSPQPQSPRQQPPKPKPYRNEQGKLDPHCRKARQAHLSASSQERRPSPMSVVSSPAEEPQATISLQIKTSSGLTWTTKEEPWDGTTLYDAVTESKVQSAADSQPTTASQTAASQTATADSQATTKQDALAAARAKKKPRGDSQPMPADSQKPPTTISERRQIQLFLENHKEFEHNLDYADDDNWNCIHMALEDYNRLVDVIIVFFM